MKAHRDEAIAEVRAARIELCARFANDLPRLVKYLRQQQRHYRGRIIKDWAEIRAVPGCADTQVVKRPGPRR